MTTLKITHDGIIPEYDVPDLVKQYNPILKKIPNMFDFSTRKHEAIPLANKLIDAMKKYGGIGLSACQIGILENVFVMGVGEHIIAYFNPVIVSQSENEIALEEGCLSFPNLFMKVKRPSSIVVEYQDYNGEFHRNIRFDGITAKCFHHEHDHLQGILFTEMVGPVTLEMAKKKQRKLNRRK